MDTDYFGGADIVQGACCIIVCAVAVVLIYIWFTAKEGLMGHSGLTAGLNWMPEYMCGGYDQLCTCTEPMTGSDDPRDYTDRELSKVVAGR
jgi:hypothetical protein